MSLARRNGWPSSAGPAEPAPRFGLHAERYAAFRPGYPDAVYDALTAAIGTPRRHAVDLGAGTGQATGALLARFERVTAVEPDAAMAALIPADPRLNVQVRTAEDARLPEASADAVVAATSFHWMDQDETPVRAARWLRPGGAFFAFAYSAPSAAGDAAANAVLHRHAGLWQAMKHRRLTAWRPYAGVLLDARAFRKVIAFEREQVWEWTAREAAGFLLTTSYASAYARSTGDEAGYEAALAHELAAAAPAGRIALRLNIEGALGLV